MSDDAWDALAAALLVAALLLLAYIGDPTARPLP